MDAAFDDWWSEHHHALVSTNYSNLALAAHTAKKLQIASVLHDASIRFISHLSLLGLNCA
jgi:hypothetical protein